MAYSTTYPYRQVLKPQFKRFTAAVKRYSSADNRVWSNDITQKSIVVRDILSYKGNSVDIDHGDSSSEINRLVQELKQKDEELQKIRTLYTNLSNQLKNMEKDKNVKVLFDASDNKQQGGNDSSDSKQQGKNDDVQIKVKGDNKITLSDKNLNADENFESVKKRAEKYEEISKERDELKKQLDSMANIKDILEKLKKRADEADEMEQEINRLKDDLQKCGHGGSGDKLNIEPTRVSSESQCNQCQEYIAEIKKSKSMLELREQMCIEIEAERNFLLQRAEMIRCMEAELILYKTKYEECECKMMNLKEIVIKAEINEKKLRDSQNRLKNMECQLQDSEMQNENLICKIERLDMDLKERDVYIECLNQRISSSHCNPAPKAIKSKECIPGKVHSIVQKISNESSKVSTCKCNIENCHCGVVSKSLCSESKESNINECHEDLITKESFVSNDSSECIGRGSKMISESEMKRLRDEMSCDEVRMLRMQNSAFDQEIKRLKDQLSCVSQILEEVEQERSSNCTLESKINDLKCRHSQELEEINSSYRSSICQKLGEIQSIEQKLNNEIGQKCELEKRISGMSEEMEEMKKCRDRCKELEESLKTLKACHKERIRELESFKCEFHKSHEENKKLTKRIEELTKNAEELNAVKNKEMCEKKSSYEQRSMIKNSVIELKKYNEEKAYMIKCYEKKIRNLEVENESLKCFRDKYMLCKDSVDDKSANVSCDDALIKKLSSFGMCALNYDELTELHDRVRCALMKATRMQSHTDLNVNYSKMIDELCKKYNISSSKELLDNLPVRDSDKCSTSTFPVARRSKRRLLQKKRSKSSVTTKFVCK